MTTENKTEQAQQDGAVAEQQTKTRQKKPRAVNAKQIWAALVLLLLLNLAAYWLWYQQDRKTQQAVTMQLSSLQQQLKAAQTELQQADTQLKQQLHSLQQQQSEQGEQIAEMLAKEPMSSAALDYEWALAEIHYLLNVANQRLLLAHDIEGAKQALAMADQRLLELADYRLYPLREIIIEEQLALSSVASTDIAGMTLQLQTVLNNVDKLRVAKGPELTSDDEATINPDSFVPETWQQAVSDIWQQVKSLVVIRHEQNGHAAVLVPEQRYFLYQNLRLKLETARFALLDRNTAVFNESIGSAIAWLQQYFVGAERDAMLGALDNMQAEQLELDLPDISRSLVWLQDFES